MVLCESCYSDVVLERLGGAGCGWRCRSAPRCCSAPAGAGEEDPTSAEGPPAPPEAQAPGPQERTRRPEPPTGNGRGGVRLAEIGAFEMPLYVSQPPGEREVLYVVEQGGRIVRVAGDRSASTFLDLSGEVSAGGERGLLSVAFAPDFQDSGLLYVDYTDTEGNTRVVEYRSPDGRSVEETSRRELLRIEQPFSNHNGGLLEFGPDGKLYIGTGDGGSGEDPDRTAQDLSSLLGKILRIDPRPGDGLPYRIPRSNPFVGSEGARGEIYAYGLRNPWRYSFDRSDGALAIGDVGQDSLEEIDLVARSRSAGANFGWSAYEGDQRLNTDQSAPDRIGPRLTYATSGGNCSVTGGYVVRDRKLRTLRDLAERARIQARPK